MVTLIAAPAKAQMMYLSLLISQLSATFLTRLPPLA